MCGSDGNVTHGGREQLAAGTELRPTKGTCSRDRSRSKAPTVKVQLK